MKLKGLLKAKYYIIYIVFLVFIINCIAALFVKAPIITDENGTMANAAFLSGLYDWSCSYNSSLTMYWGYGYAFLWILLFYFFNDMFFVYKMICILNAVIVSFIPLIVYQLIKENFRDIPLKVNYSISFILGFLPINFIFSKNAWNEPMLLLLQWLIVYILLKSYRARGKRKRLYGFILGLFCVYACTVHERGIVCFLAIMIGFLINYILIRHMWVSIVPFLISFILGFRAHTSIKAYIVNNLLKIDSSLARNTSESLIGKNLLVIFEPKNFVGFLKGLFGQFYYIVFSSLGFCIVALIAVVCICYKILKSNSRLRKEKNFLALSIYTFLVFGGTLLISSIFYYKSYITNTTRGLEYYLYGRYNEGIIGIVILLALIFLYYLKKENRPKLLKIMVLSSLIVALIGVTSIFLICDVLKITTEVFNEVNISFFTAFVRSGFLENAKIGDFIQINILIFVLMISLFFLYFNSHKNVLTVILVFTLFLVVDLRYFQESLMVRNDKQYNQVADLNEFLSKNKEMRLIENIYLSDVSTRTLTVQMVFPKSNVTFLNTKTYGYDQLGNIEKNSIVMSEKDEEFDKWLDGFYFIDSIGGYYFWSYGDYPLKWGDLEGRVRENDVNKLTIKEAYKKENSNYKVIVNNYQSGSAINWSEQCIATQTSIFIEKDGEISFKNRVFLPHEYELYFYGENMDNIEVYFLKNNRQLDINLKKELVTENCYKIRADFDKLYKNLVIVLKLADTNETVAFQRMEISH